MNRNLVHGNWTKGHGMKWMNWRPVIELNELNWMNWIGGQWMNWIGGQWMKWIELEASEWIELDELNWRPVNEVNEVNWRPQIPTNFTSSNIHEIRPIFFNFQFSIFNFRFYGLRPSTNNVRQCSMMWDKNSNYCSNTFRAIISSHLSKGQIRIYLSKFSA